MKDTWVLRTTCVLYEGDTWVLNEGHLGAYGRTLWCLRKDDMLRPVCEDVSLFLHAHVVHTLQQT